MQWPFLTKMQAATAAFYLGDAAGALDGMRVVLAEEPPRTVYDGLPQTNLFAMHAWAGLHDRARSLIPDVSVRLARVDRHNAVGPWLSAMVAVAALALLDERPACASLYPVARAFADLGNRCDGQSMGPITPELAAGIGRRCRR